MGDIFSLGFGPFRWVCTSCDPDDLLTTDTISAEVMESLIKSGGEPVLIEIFISLFNDHGQVK